MDYNKMQDIFFYSHTKIFKEFSNFWISPFIILGKEWKTVEHYYQAMKSTDPVIQERIRNLNYPSEAKRIGNMIDLRDNWDDVKEIFMMKALKGKFLQNEDLKNLLLGTGSVGLHESSPTDKYWGFNGKDRLGILLMALREKIRNKELLS